MWVVHYVETELGFVRLKYSKQESGSVMEEEEIGRPEVNYPERGRVLVSGEESMITITEAAVMFERKDGSTWGFDRSTIRSVKWVKGEPAWVIAYSINGEIRSVKVSVIAWLDPSYAVLGRTEFPGDIIAMRNALDEFISNEDSTAAYDYCWKPRNNLGKNQPTPNPTA